MKRIIACIFLGFSCFLFWTYVPQVMKEQVRLVTSKRTQATVIRAWIEHDAEGGYYPFVEYEYTVFREKKKSSQIFPGTFYRNNSKWAEKVISAFSKGNTVPAYFSQQGLNQTPQSFLLPQLSDDFFGILFATGGLLVSMLILFYDASPRRKRKIATAFTILWFLVGIVTILGHFLLHIWFQGLWITPLMLISSVFYGLFGILCIAATLPESAKQAKEKLIDFAGGGLLGGCIGIFLIGLGLGIFVENLEDFLMVDKIWNFGLLSMIGLGAFFFAFIIKKKTVEQIR